jgi:RNA polymerase sigma factor (sigma-70 family)
VLRNREEAEDVMQESILKGFGRLNELKEAEKYVGWQKMIAVRMALNILRSKKSTELLFDVNEMPDAAEPEVELQSLDVELLKQKIEDMPHGYRLVLKLHLEEEMSHEEIGEHLGINASTSRSQYCRAIAKLKDEMLNTHAKQI